MNIKCFSIRGKLFCLLVVFASLSCTGCKDSSVAEELRALAGAPVRVVWCRQQPNARDVYARGNRFTLMGLCTEDGIGERVILGGTGNYHKPLLSADGSRIVFTDAPTKTIYVVNWNGTGLYELGKGVAEDVWVDPDTGVEWVYSLVNSTSVRESSSPLLRFQLDNPAVQEVILEGTGVNSDHVQVSKDGSYLCLQYPWPNIGRLHAPTGDLSRSGKGCWPSMAPDNSYLMWIFDGAHRNLIMHSFEGKDRWVVNVNGAPGIDGYEVYHPRWSNRTRFMSMTGPYWEGLMNTKTRVNVYVGRFNEDLTAVEAWQQVTSHKKSDYYPDVWIEPGTGGYAHSQDGHVSSVKESSKNAEKLVVNACLLEVTPIPTLEEIAPYTQTLVVYRYEVESVVSGSYDSSTLLVAHWGIVNRVKRDLVTNVGDSVRLELEPYENRGELEGERLVMDLSNMNAPMFYDLNGK